MGMQALKDRSIRFLRENWLFLLVVGGLLVGFMAFRTQASALGTVAEVDAVLQNGEPTLIEFYSNT
jgi:hypothetical protein